MDVDLNLVATIVERLRALGVVQFKAAGLELTILPDAPTVAEVPEPSRAVEQPPKRGKDGLTRDEQIEMYGRVLDSEV